MMNRVSKQNLILPVFFLALFMVMGVLAPPDANARREMVDGSGMVEGDPGDGDDSMEGGGGSFSGSINPPLGAVTPWVTTGIIYDYQLFIMPLGTYYSMKIFPSGLENGNDIIMFPFEIISVGGE